MKYKTCARAPLLWSISLIMLLLMQGCGFHLRGSDSGSAGSDVKRNYSITGVAVGQPIHAALREAIQNRGGKVVAKGEANIHVINSVFKKSVFTYDAERDADSYLLTLNTQFSVTQNGQVSPRRSARASQSVDYDADEVLASDEQLDIVTNSMYAQVARNILTSFDFLEK